jgi:hypothetical protein
MSTDISPQTRKIVVTIVLAAAVLMIVAVPFIVHEMLNPVLAGQVARIEKNLSLGTPEGNAQAAVLKIIPWSIGFIFPLWASLSLIAGFMLFAIALPLYRGETWARGAALTALAIPSIAGAFMLVPWMNFVGSVQGGFPPALLIMAIGLIPYFAILLADKASWATKTAYSLVFLMLGVTAAENFANAHAAFRIYYGHPQRPLFAPGIPVLWLAFPVLWITSFMLVVAIYKLGARQQSGWYLAMAAGGATFVASLATHYVRHATNDYLYGALMGLSIVVLLVIPAVKKALFPTGAGEPAEAKRAVQAHAA